MRIPLTIIVPAKHEEHTIIPTLRSLETSVRTPHKIIVVNVSDAKDKTAVLVQRYRRAHPRVSIIRKIHSHGTFGMPLALGFTAVKTGAVVPFMADVCDDPKDIDRMYKILNKGWDMVAASRYMPGGQKIGGPATQSLFSYLVCKTLRILTGVPTSDISNAFKMYNVEALKNITVNPQSGVEASMEIALAVYFRGARITEIPTVWKGRTAGQSKFRLVERFPRYLKIYLWAIGETLK